MSDLEIIELDDKDAYPWTPEEIMEAEPVAFPELDPKDVTPDEEADIPRGDAEGSVWRLDPEPADKIIAQPVPPQDLNQRPASSVGVLAFLDHEGKRRRGTGFSYLRSSLVMTAAHCVNEGGIRGAPRGTHSNFVWMPDFGRGNILYRPKSILFPAKWRRFSSWSADYAFLIFGGPAGGGPPLGGIYGLPIGQRWTAYGWPADPPFNRGKQYRASGGHQVAPYRGNPMGMHGNDMSGGCSGGPWIAHGQEGRVNGLNSFALDSRPNVMWGPYFGTQMYNDTTTALNQAP